MSLSLPPSSPNVPPFGQGSEPELSPRLEPEISPEVLRKRLRGREYVRKHYEKKKTTISSIRDQLQGLELEYKNLLEARKLSHSIAERDRAADKGASQLRAQYNKLLQLKQSLYEENEALYRLHTDKMILGGRLQQVIDMEAQPSIAEIPFHFVPLPMEHYAAAIARCHDRALKFVHLPDRLTSGMSVFGWRDYRKVTGTELTYALEKQFDGLTAEESAERYWARISHPKTFCSTFSASLNSSLYPLQYIDRDTILLYWTMKPSGVPVTTKLLIVLARRAVPEGYIISCTTIDKDIIQFDEDGINDAIVQARDQNRDEPGTPPRSVYWAKATNCVYFERVGLRSSRCHFCGHAQAKGWILEVLLRAMRWENHVFGLRLLRAD